METMVCKKLRRKHVSINARYDNNEKENQISTKDYSTKGINVDVQCQNLVSNCKQRTRASTPFIQSGTVPFESLSPSRMPRKKICSTLEGRRPILNRDKQCNDIFELREDPECDVEMPRYECSQVIHQRYGRKLVISKSVDYPYKTDASCENEEITPLLKPRKPCSESPTNPGKILPSVKPPIRKHKSLPPQNLLKTKNDYPNHLSNYSSFSLPDVGNTNIGSRYNINIIVRDDTSSCSRDEYDCVSDIEEVGNVGTVNKDLYEYLESVNNIEDNR